ncbi:hypothetical protein MY04_4391 [Flammeovirga sp. MY04]|uniref:hypothetical protein n=1 Tax=Flammeovirga sp. MY04 TaxID=1191459 RepID=UPI00080636B8|nr:hypothetical protein [Flammeovirga sp. MY04]ANQ51729.1 hypothetical protein MY04_4391 [Flammeovirga sp. MY04]
MKKLFILLLITTFFSSTTLANCFQERIEEYSETMKFSLQAKRMEVSAHFYFKINNNKIEIDSTQSFEKANLFEKAIEDILNTEICSDFPQKFEIQFTWGKNDSLFFSGNNRVVITKQSAKYMINPAKSTYEYFEKSKLKIKGEQSWYFDVDIVESKKKTAFKYTFTKEENPNRSDDECMEGVYFQIPKDSKNFKYRDEELKKAKLYYKRICFGNCGRKYIVKGYLKGEKKGNEWIIEIQFDDKLIKGEFLLVNKAK